MQTLTQTNDLLAIMKRTEELALAAAEPKTIVYEYADGRRTTIVGDRTFDEKPPAPSIVYISTLTSLVDYIKSDKNERVLRDATTVLIEDCNVIKLLTDDVPAYMGRHTLAVVKPCLPEKFSNDSFMSPETFTIELQSKFVRAHDYAAVANCCTGIHKDDGAQYSDNGVAQTVTVKTGLSLAKTVTVPNPVKLAPYRTFPEIEQPTSEYVLRLSDGKDGLPRIGLFEADGGAWRVQCCKTIKEWLQKELEGTGILILA